MRGKIKAGVVLGLAALTATVVLPAAASTASRSAATPYYVQWKPHTKLPKVQAGWRLMALPTQAAMAGLKIGQKVPWVKPSRAKPNTAGIVNLEAAPAYCAPSSVIKTFGPRKTNVAQSYATTSGKTLTFTYGSGQSSSLGVSSSNSTDPGSWSESGTVSISTDATQGFPKFRHRAFIHWQTYFSYEEYKQACAGITYWWVQAYQWDSGAHIKHVKGAPAAPHCVRDAAGATFSKATTKASTFSVGATIPVVNVSVSAQTGYSTTAAVGFTFRTAGRLCGVKNTPPNNPGVIVAAAKAR
jgi:hypothetical protein